MAPEMGVPEGIGAADQGKDGSDLGPYELALN